MLWWWPLRSPAKGRGEWAASVPMAHSLPGAHQKALGAGKGYDTRVVVADARRGEEHPGAPEVPCRWPDPPCQPAQPAAGTGRKEAAPADQQRFSVGNRAGMPGSRVAAFSGAS